MISSAVLACYEQLPKLKEEHFNRILTYLMIIIKSYYVGEWYKIYKEKCNIISIHTYNTENM